MSTATIDQDARVAAQSERALLGALMLDNRAWQDVRNIVNETHISAANHRSIFSAIARLSDDGELADAVLVMDLMGTTLVEACGGADYIADLVRDVPSASNVRAYAKNVRDFANRSKIVDISEGLAARARLGQSASDALEHAKKQLGEMELGEAQKPVRRPMRWAELATQSLPERRWRISHWLGRNEPLLFAGAGGIGKTLLAQTIGTALALGRPFLDDVTEPCNVLIWACEDDHDELWRRQHAICRYFGVDMADLEGKLIIEPRRGLENTLMDLAYGAPVWTRLRTELREQINDYRANVFFCDNLGQTYGGKENDRHQATTFCNGLAGLSDDCTPAIMGHPAKAVGSEFSGSGAWENAVRMRWYMGYKLPDQETEDGETPDPNVRFLAKRKANYSDKDYRKLIYRDGLFQPETRDAVLGPPLSQAVRMDSAKACLIAALERLARSGIRTTDGKNSPDYLPRKMREMNLTHDHSPRDLMDALSQLRLNGQIIEGAVGKYQNRTPKFGLVLAQSDAQSNR